MYKEMVGFAKGMGTGIAAGVAVSLIGNKMMRENKHLRRNVNKTMRAMGGLMDNVGVIFKQ